MIYIYIYIYVYINNGIMYYVLGIIMNISICICFISSIVIIIIVIVIIIIITIIVQQVTLLAIVLSRPRGTPSGSIIHYQFIWICYIRVLI